MALESYSLDASMWGKNGPIGDFTYNFNDLYKEVSGDPTYNFQVGNNRPAFLYANASGSLGLDYKLGFGLIGSLKLASGDVHSDYSFDPNVKDASSLGYSTVLDTSGWTRGAGSLSSNGFDLSKSGIDLNLAGTAYARLHGDIHVNAGVYTDPVKVFGVTVIPGIDTDIGNPGTSFSTTLVDYSFNKNLLHLTGESQPFNYDYGYGKLSAKLPGSLSTNSQVISGDGLGSISATSTSDPFITANFNAAAALGALFGIPPEVFQGSKSVDIGIGSLGYDYTTLAANLTGKVSLRQDFSFTPQVDVAMKTSFGQTVTGKLGDKFSFDTPQGEGDFDVTANYDLSGDLTSKTGLYLSSSLDLQALQATLREHFNGASIFGYSIGSQDWSQNIGPLVNQSFPIGGGALIPLYSDTSKYDLGTKSETYKVHYEKFVDATSSNILHLTTHQTTVFANSNGDTIYGNNQINTLFGGAGNDTFVMGNGSGDSSKPSYAYGSGGDNIFKADLGNNVLYGDAGIDTSGLYHYKHDYGYNLLDYSATSDAITFDLASGTVTKSKGIDTFYGIEGFTGGMGNDLFYLGKSTHTIPVNYALSTASAEVSSERPVGYDGSYIVVNGGGGRNTADFMTKLSDVSLSHDVSGNAIYVSPNGSYEFSSIQRFRFTDGDIDRSHDGSLFDSLYYDVANKDVWAAAADPVNHYAQYGWHEGRDPNALFSTNGYLAANTDVAKAGLNPLTHYDQYGWHEGRDPSANFDIELYLLNNPDVKAAGIDPLAHYLQYGQSEGRQSYSAIGQSNSFNHGSFDAEYYLLANTDVAKAALTSGGDTFAFAFQHYQNYGAKEGRSADAFFDSAYYLAHNPDVAAAGMNPLTHYDLYGWKEGRDPSAVFHTNAYLAANSDVAAAHIDPLQHYLQYGADEGRHLS